MRITKQCYSCKQQFKKSELIDYVSATAKIPHSYCPKCLKEKQERERFADKVCSIFGIKAPGPRIWTERKRLQDTYGYTDDVIIDCLEYIYNVERHKGFSESLYLVQPPMVEKMRAYKKQVESNVVSPQNKMNEYVVPVRENITKKPKLMNPDDFLDD